MSIDSIQRVIDYIEENISDNITVQQLAKVSVYSKWDFSKLFSILTNLSPAKYIRRCKLTDAYLILISNKSLYDACKKPGLINISFGQGL